LHKRGVSAYKVDTESISRALKRMRQANVALGSDISAYHRDRCNRHALIDDRNAVALFHILTNAYKLFGFFGYFIVFAFISYFSNRIIRPISESYEKQKRFITDASHEIKTPLTIIGADTDVLEMEIGENEWLLDIKKQISQLTELTNDLVFLSRMEESERTLPMIDFPFSEVAAETVMSFQSLAHRQGKTINYHIPQMLTLCGDEKSIRQLISILLDNAIKYAPAQTEISFSVEKQSNHICMVVTNTTQQPIEKKQITLLFDRFYRMDASRNSQTGGHGVGLSIAKAIVEAHHGKIQASSPKEKTLQLKVTL
jgi:signal transduction histidine kinase